MRDLALTLPLPHGALKALQQEVSGKDKATLSATGWGRQGPQHHRESDGASLGGTGRSRDRPGAGSVEATCRRRLLGLVVRDVLTRGLRWHPSEG